VYKNDWTDREAVLGLTLEDPKNHVLDGGQDRKNKFVAASGDKPAMRPFASLLWTFVSICVIKAVTCLFEVLVWFAYVLLTLMLINNVDIDLSITWSPIEFAIELKKTATLTLPEVASCERTPAMTSNKPVSVHRARSRIFTRDELFVVHKLG